MSRKSNARGQEGTEWQGMPPKCCVQNFMAWGLKVMLCSLFRWCFTGQKGMQGCTNHWNPAISHWSVRKIPRPQGTGGGEKVHFFWYYWQLPQESGRHVAAIVSSGTDIPLSPTKVPPPPQCNGLWTPSSRYNLVQNLHPPPPSGPPKVLEPALWPVEVFRESGGTTGAGNFFPGIHYGGKSCTTHVCTLNAQNTWGISGAMQNLTNLKTPPSPTSNQPFSSRQLTLALILCLCIFVHCTCSCFKYPVHSFSFSITGDLLASAPYR